jgi:hypothetical protein
MSGVATATSFLPTLPWFCLGLPAIGGLYVLYLPRARPGIVKQAASIIMGESDPVERTQVLTADERG